MFGLSHMKPRDHWAIMIVPVVIIVISMVLVTQKGTDLKMCLQKQNL